MSNTQAALPESSNSETESCTSSNSLSPPSNSRKRPRSDNSPRTRHPVYHGVRMRTWGKWVSEIREPRKKNRIWLGTFATADAAARAHDAAVRAIKGSSAVLNFPELAACLPTPASNCPRDVQAAAAIAAAMEFPTSAPSAAAAESTCHSQSSSSSSLISQSSSSSLSETYDAPTTSDELSEIVELPSLGTSYESAESGGEFALVDPGDDWVDPSFIWEQSEGHFGYLTDDFVQDSVITSGFGAFL